MLGIFWFMMLGYRDPINPEEGRYKVGEMLIFGDWITRRPNGFKYFEKPPQQY